MNEFEKAGESGRSISSKRKESGKMRGNRKLLRSGLMMVAIGGLMAAGLAAAATESSTPAQHTGARGKMMHHGMRHGVVSEVGDLKFRTVLMGSEIDVYMLDKTGKQSESIGSATGTATLTFPDGSTKDATLAKATGAGPEHLTGTWEASTASPTQASVNLTGLPGTPSEAAYTAAFPQMKPRTHAAGNSSSGSSSSSSKEKSSDGGTEGGSSGK
jgi:hypothetical protein